MKKNDKMCCEKNGKEKRIEESIAIHPTKGIRFLKKI